MRISENYYSIAKGKWHFKATGSVCGQSLTQGYEHVWGFTCLPFHIPTVTEMEHTWNKILSSFFMSYLEDKQQENERIGLPRFFSQKLSEILAFCVISVSNFRSVFTSLFKYLDLTATLLFHGLKNICASTWAVFIICSKRFLCNLVPRVFRLFGQRGNAGKTLGTSNFITAGFLR